MHVLLAALTAPLISTALAQQSLQYTVWSSVVFQRTGERTPDIINNDTTILTSLGAQQAHAAGQFFRSRYITSELNGTNGTDGAGDQGAPLAGLNADAIDYSQLNANARDLQYDVATAYAFLQGLYPPWTPTTSQGALPESNVLANGTYVRFSETARVTGGLIWYVQIDSPLNGYQYPQVHVASGYDPNFLYLSAHYDCPNWRRAANDWDETPQFSVTQKEFDDIYAAIGSAVLLGVVPQQTWDYYNAYAIYDYLSYQYVHNSTVQKTLDRYSNVITNTSHLTTLRWLADEQNYAQYGNLSSVNPATGSQSLPDSTKGSISTIGGNFLVENILSSLGNAILTQGQVNKLTLLFADFQPLTSFFALAGLPDLNSNFYGMAEYGSSAAFELYSYTNSSTKPVFPDAQDLFVRFLFRNGTEGNFQSYPLFGNGPSNTDILWTDFKLEMQERALGNVGVWCELCSAPSAFCTGWESSSSASGSSNSRSSKHHKLSPVAAGAIGAVVALAVAALIFGAIMLFGRVRLHRNPSSSKRSGDLGGFKGGQKMRSDQDLSIPKGGAVVESHEQGHDSVSPIGHERMGSWELKQKHDQEQEQEQQRNWSSLGDGHSEFRPSFVEEDAGRPSFAVEGEGRPVVPHERV